MQRFSVLAVLFMGLGAFALAENTAHAQIYGGGVSVGIGRGGVNVGVGRGVGYYPRSFRSNYPRSIYTRNYYDVGRSPYYRYPVRNYRVPPRGYYGGGGFYGGRYCPY